MRMRMRAPRDNGQRMTGLAAVFEAFMGHKERTECEGAACRHFGEVRETNVPVPLEGDCRPVQGKRRGYTSFVHMSDMYCPPMPGDGKSKRRGKRAA